MGTIERLEALERAATAGPWKWNHDELNARYKKRDGRRRKNNQLVFSLDGPKHNPDMIEGAADAYDYQSVMRLWWHSVKGTSIVNANPSPKDAELIVAARNAIGPLLAVAKAAKAYHKLAAGHYDPDRQDEFYRLQADLGEAIERLEATP